MPQQPYRDFGEDIKLVKKYGGVPFTKPEVKEAPRYTSVRVPKKALKAESNYWARLTRSRAEEMEG